MFKYFLLLLWYSSRHVLQDSSLLCVLLVRPGLSVVGVCDICAVAL